MKVKTLALLLSACVTILSAAEPFRTFENTQGQKIEARPKHMTGNSIVLELKNGKIYSVAVNKLSPADQAFIAKWKKNAPKPIPRLDISFTSGKSDEDADNISDHRIQTFKPKVVVNNRDTQFDIENAKVTVLGFGKSVASRSYSSVIFKNTYTFSLKSGQTAELEGKQIRIEYDDEGIKHGYKYSGYIAVMQTEGGDIVKVAGSGANARLHEDVITSRVLLLKQDDVFKRDFEVDPDPPVY